MYTEVRRYTLSGIRVKRRYAFDPADGTELWATDYGGSAWSTPTFEAGPLSVGCADGRVPAVDASDGSTKWTHAMESPVAASPVFRDGMVSVGTRNGRLLALAISLVSARGGRHVREWEHRYRSPRRSGIPAKQPTRGDRDISEYDDSQPLPAIYEP